MTTIADFFKRYGANTTTNFQLMKWAKEIGIPNFHIVMRDEMKKLPKHYEFIYVIGNLHLKKQRGVHWFCFCRTRENGSFFFDSYGLEPTKEVEKVLTKPFIYSTHKLQDDEKFCGVLCLFVLYWLKEGKKFEDIILDLRSQLFLLKNAGNFKTRI